MDEITLISKDFEEFIVDARIFRGSMIDDMPAHLKDVPIPLPLINASILRKVIEWCQHRYNHSSRERDRLLQDRESPEWEKSFLQVNEPSLIPIIQAADYLAIDPLVHISCKKVASLFKLDSVFSVSHLDENMQAQIACNVPPVTLKKAAEDRRIMMTPIQEAHNRLWTSFFRNDDWFEALSDLLVDANPILIGKSLGRDETYVVLSSMDWSGDILYDKRLLRKSLKEHDFDDTTYECTMRGSTKILNIWESRGDDHSDVPNVEERLVETELEGTRWTSISYLRYPYIQRLKSKNKPNKRIAVLCEKCINPSNGKPLRWLCVDSKDVGYRPYNAFQK